MSNQKTPYWQKLQDPRWQRKRLEILERDSFRCRECGDATSTLHIHHSYYKKGLEPWEYPDCSLRTVCETHHELRAEIEAQLLCGFSKYSIAQMEMIIIDLSFLDAIGKPVNYLPELLCSQTGQIIDQMLRDNPLPT